MFGLPTPPYEKVLNRLPVTARMQAVELLPLFRRALQPVHATYDDIAVGSFIAVWALNDPSINLTSKSRGFLMKYLHTVDKLPNEVVEACRHSVHELIADGVIRSRSEGQD